ncbi:hypothetical protein I6N96_04015 [Enterococcus sp. BWM-S5]|uniref:Uncharacterized protein n=1 Tax=Enterococcus larvae TaxID=2794352 RepID=A0ABS4CHD1_9ENTE|nr:hypothetical protein [Enterococcus larvae]MBP1045430.1 hypothetical protein [Enterococcus larvae]
MTAHDVTAYPKTKEQKQAFCREVRQIQEAHPRFSIEVTYDCSQMEILSNVQRKQEIQKIGELVKQFEGFIEVDKGYQVNCYIKTEGRAEVIRSNRYK